MTSRQRIAAGVAALAATAALAAPLGLTSGDGSIDVFVGSTPTATATATETATPTPTPTPTATPFTTANVWVNTTAGASPQRCSTACAYDSAHAYGTFDAAWDAASAGDRICVSAGTYGTQIVTGDKASETTFTGNCGGAVTIGPGSGTVTCTGLSGPGADATFCPDGENLTLADVTIETGAANDVSSAARINHDNTTFRDVDIAGDRPQIYVTASGFLWDGGTHGDATATYTCSSTGQPTQIDSGSMVIQGVYWYPKTIEGGAANEGNCGDDGNPHLEYTRIECNCPVTLKNNYYAPGGAPGSGYIFSGISGALNDLVVAGNYFADIDVSSYMQAGNLTGCTGWLWLYNTFDDGDVGSTPGFNLGSCSGGTAAGNLGPSAPGSCANHVKNVTQGSGACGTDTRIGTDDLGVTSTTGRLEAGSPGIDAGETAPGTYCGGSVVDGTDREGDERGADGTCDAGADER